jgi:hypothetical protein
VGWNVMPDTITLENVYASMDNYVALRSFNDTTVLPWRFCVLQMLGAAEYENIQRELM